MTSRNCDWFELAEWNALEQRLLTLVEEGHFSAIAIQGYAGVSSSPVLQAGRSRADRDIQNDSLFLVASLTKPIIAVAMLQLVERGVCALNQRVSQILPEWNRGERRRITIRQLLCHASGLPDQLPENFDLRHAGASLSEFYERVVEAPLDYSPGTSSRYQSMGYLVVGHLLEHFYGQPLPVIVREQIFAPLGMTSSFLGRPPDEDADQLLDRVIDVQLPENQRDLVGNWNSHYWRGLGAPWGGLLSTPNDLTRFCIDMLNCSRGKGILLQQDSFLETRRPQLNYFDQMSERERSFRSWGLGWRHNWKAHPETFGDTLPSDIIGHWGATGCLFWLNPDKDRAAVICTTRPTSQSRLEIVRLSNQLLCALQACERKIL